MAGKDAPTTDLTAEILASYDAVVEKVAALRVETHQTLSHIKEEREELTEQLQKDLAKGESLRKADFQKLIGEVIAARKEREREVTNLLADFQREEQEIAQGLKKLFSDEKQARLQDFKKFLEETHQADRARRSEVEEIAPAIRVILKSAEETIAAFREEREAMAKSWRTLAENMQERRAKKTTTRTKKGALPTTSFGNMAAGTSGGLRNTSTPATSFGSFAGAGNKSSTAPATSFGNTAGDTGREPKNGTPPPTSFATPPVEKDLTTPATRNTKSRKTTEE